MQRIVSDSSCLFEGGIYLMLLPVRASVRVCMHVCASFSIHECVFHTSYACLPAFLCICLAIHLSLCLYSLHRICGEIHRQTLGERNGNALCTLCADVFGRVLSLTSSSPGHIHGRVRILIRGREDRGRQDCAKASRNTLLSTHCFKMASSRMPSTSSRSGTRV